ncbi:MAG TPA: peptidylprolyl isomerase [Anaerolineales bacterium]|nr:peptidylprolyl isomerase [Anaerolineales bacterium]
MNSLVLMAWLVSACNGNQPVPTSTQSLPTNASSTEIPTDIPTPLPPTPTPVPLAATVNGEPITLAEFQGELARYIAAQSENETLPPEGAETRVLNDLIDQVLLTQGAREAGFSLDPAALKERRDQIAFQAGGEDNLAAWQANLGYTEEAFLAALARSSAAAWMRDRVAAETPETAEQVHARQILLFNRDQAEEMLARIESGEDFSSLAAAIDPTTGGDLGWFPRGYLTVHDLELVAFQLQPGEVSPIVETAIGFHLLQVVERDPQRPLDPDTRLMVQLQTLKDWLENRRETSDIQIFSPP